MTAKDVLGKAIAKTRRGTTREKPFNEHDHRKEAHGATKAGRHCLAPYTAWPQLLLAETPASAVKMIAQLDQAQGQLVVAGQYEKTIEKLVAKTAVVSKFSTQYNLCAACTKDKNSDPAEAAGEKAVALRNNTTAPLNPYMDDVRQNEARDKTIALSNRGVLHVIKGGRQSALQDFEESVQV